MITPLSQTDLINILKTIYPPDYVNAMLNGSGSVYINIYAAIFASLTTTISDVQKELYFGLADDGWLDLLAYGERGIIRSAEETDAQLSTRATAPLDTITPNAMLDAANAQLSVFGYPKNAIYMDGGNYPGMATDTTTTFIDPTTGNITPMSAVDSGVRTWSLATSKAFFAIVVPNYSSIQYGFHTDAMTVLTDTSGFPEGSNVPLSATDSLNGLPVDGDLSTLKVNLYSAIWNQINKIKAGGVGLAIIIGTI